MTTPAAPTHHTQSSADPVSLPKLMLGIAATVLVLDQLTKLVIDTIIGPDRSRMSWWFIGDWLGFDYVQNRGVAFGIKIGGSTMTVIVSCVAFFIIGLIFWRLAGKDRFAAIGIGLMAGGAFGNVIDRLRFDAVVDFVAVGPFPRFNVADSAITIGVLMLAWSASGSHQAAADAEEEERDEYGGTTPQRPQPE